MLLVNLSSDISTGKYNSSARGIRKMHGVLVVADATVFLIEKRSAYTDDRSQKHTSMFYSSCTRYGWTVTEK